MYTINWSRTLAKIIYSLISILRYLLCAFSMHSRIIFERISPANVIPVFDFFITVIILRKCHGNCMSNAVHYYWQPIKPTFEGWSQSFTSSQPPTLISTSDWESFLRGFTVQSSPDWCLDLLILISSFVLVTASVTSITREELL